MIWRGILCCVGYAEVFIHSVVHIIVLSFSIPLSLIHSLLTYSQYLCGILYLTYSFMMMTLWRLLEVHLLIFGSLREEEWWRADIDWYWWPFCYHQYCVSTMWLCIEAHWNVAIISMTICYRSYLFSPVNLFWPLVLICVTIQCWPVLVKSLRG